MIKNVNNRIQIQIQISMIKIFSENSFYDPWPCNKWNTQTKVTPVSLNLFNYTDNADPISLQLSIKSNISGKQNIIKVLQISTQYYALFLG